MATVIWLATKHATGSRLKESEREKRAQNGAAEVVMRMRRLRLYVRLSVAGLLDEAARTTQTGVVKDRGATTMAGCDAARRGCDCDTS